jgi:hypothetical protein
MLLYVPLSLWERVRVRCIGDAIYLKPGARRSLAQQNQKPSIFAKLRSLTPPLSHGEREKMCAPATGGDPDR